MTSWNVEFNECHKQAEIRLLWMNIYLYSIVFLMQWTIEFSDGFKSKCHFIVKLRAIIRISECCNKIMVSVGSKVMVPWVQLHGNVTSLVWSTAILVLLRNFLFCYDLLYADNLRLSIQLAKLIQRCRWHNADNGNSVKFTIFT